jgi:histidinol-phosphate aminotransferase
MAYKPTVRWQDLVRSNLLRLKGFAASKSSGSSKGLQTVIKLDANENPYGCSPRVQQALATFTHLNFYPEPEQVELRKLLETYTGIASERIVATAGGEQLIELILLLLLERGDKVINCVPTFDVFRLKVETYGGTVVNVPRDGNFAVDVKAVKAAIDNKTKIILLATPNNPTGTVTPKEDILT